MIRTWLTILGILVGVFTADPGSVHAQDPDLDQVERLMAEARFESARERPPRMAGCERRHSDLGRTPAGNLAPRALDH